jgi:flagellin-like hook-associated protein FlgL
VQDTDLVLADDPLAPGTIAALGLAGATIPGAGTSAGQGDAVEPSNLINTLIQVRDELHGYAARQSRLSDLLDEDGQSLGLFPGATIRINSDGTTLEFKVQRFTTMQDLAEKIEEKLGFQMKVDVLRDGKIEIFNPTTSVINDISIEALDEQGGHVTAFEDKFASISGKLFYRGQLRSDTVYEDERFQRMTERLGDMDDALDTILSALAVLGSRYRRLTITRDQNEVVEGSLAELQTQNDVVDMAATIIQLKEQENVLNAALGSGARVLPPSLFDFMQ